MEVLRVTGEALGLWVGGAGWGDGLRAAAVMPVVILILFGPAGGVAGNWILWEHVC